MRTRSSLPFRAAPLRVEDPPSHGTLLTAFLSSLSLDERSACAVLFGAAARHFLHWLELHGIAVRTIDDRAARRFEKHRCRCHRYSAQQSVYKADIAARVRRFVRFLEDQGYVEVDDGIDDLPRHLADYSDAINRLQLAQGPAQSYRRYLPLPRNCRGRHQLAPPPATLTASGSLKHQTASSWLSMGCGDPHRMPRHQVALRRTMAGAICRTDTSRRPKRAHPGFGGRATCLTYMQRKRSIHCPPAYSTRSSGRNPAIPPSPSAPQARRALVS